MNTLPGLTKARAFIHEHATRFDNEAAQEVLPALDAAMETLDRERAIAVYIRNEFGNERVYPANPEQAKELGALTGGKTLSPAQVRALTALGFTVAQVPDPKARPLASTLFSIGLSGLPRNPGDTSPR